MAVGSGDGVGVWVGVGVGVAGGSVGVGVGVLVGGLGVGVRVGVGVTVGVGLPVGDGVRLTRDEAEIGGGSPFLLIVVFPKTSVLNVLILFDDSGNVSVELPVCCADAMYTIPPKTPAIQRNASIKDALYAVNGN